MSSEIDCIRYATRLFSGLLLQPPLRFVMKAELGAFYPLLILRPMEAIPYNPPQLAAALHVLQVPRCGRQQFYKSIALMQLRAPLLLLSLRLGFESLGFRFYYYDVDVALLNISKP
jgi:hypothetical protein